ncbi:MAG TPA: metallophosphoesterase [Synergistales bacterium]|nr:metallophosphoesterase [Synergistales bacterium]
MNRHMIVFLSLYVLLYGLMHLYFYLGLRHLAGAGIIRALYPVFSVFMIMGPVLSRWCEYLGAGCLEKYLAWVSYLWMGFLFLTISLMIIMDLSRAVAWTVGFRKSAFYGGFFAPSRRFLLCLILSAALCIYGYGEAFSIGSDHMVLRSDKIPQNAGMVRIVQISDIHLGLMVGRRKVELILDTIRQWSPHILVCTGDLVDGQMGTIDGISLLFSEMGSPMGKYAVTGNHEFYVGYEQSGKFIEKAGFTLLRGETVILGDTLAITGVDDPAVRLFNGNAGPSEEELLRQVPDSLFHILLKHQPVSEEGSRGLFDLQLSGHIHGGQIFPFSLLTRLVYPYGVGLHDLGQGSRIYVSSGAGTWGPPYRVLASPQITVIDVVSGNPETRGDR